MSFFKSIFTSKKSSITSYSDFWIWFEQNENKFSNVLKNHGDINKVFFEKLAPKLNQVKDGIWFLAGMYDKNTAELILTADGVIKNIVFVEELVEAAPKINNWKITALKQPSKLNQYGIEIEGYKFDENTMRFYSNFNKQMPDEIDITIAHKDFREDNKDIMMNGVYLSLDNSLGELNAVTTIDNLNIINPKDASSELIGLEKLKDFLIWREKEFVEKYEGFRHNTENDNYSGLEATINNGLPVVAMVNRDLLEWDGKASHPWITVLEIIFDGKNNNGMPNESQYKLLDEVENKIMEQLKDSEGYLNIGRQTANSVREVYFACVEFRKPSKVFHRIKEEYKNNIKLEFDIYKDKYWQSFNRFMKN
ncbi:DUF695 domain-containing protein [Aquimarina brevivitae]|uniref:Uncharacterized protein DUF695 n=1 Tax=Aquimarina brevivitae TaxID=323412 RepID=A0A4Q7PJ00_9FLAO|nr:DUF695 domain-containing protein [Aquimarina brevivitae]RZT00248.1 uncharacterized protein DUF695 [Aquimarina brevivitae]